MKNLMLFREYLWAFKSRLALLFCIIFSSAFFEGIGTGLFFPLIEYVQKGESFLTEGKFEILFDGMKFAGISPTVLNFILVIFFVIFCTLFLKYFTQIVSAWTYNPMMKQIRDEGFKRIINSPMQYFHSVSSGKVVSALGREVDRAGQSINFLTLIVTNVVSLLVYAFFAILISWKLTLMVAVIALVRYKVLGFFIKESRILGEQNTRILAFLNSYLVGIYQGIDVVKSYATEKREHKRFKQMTGDFLAILIGTVKNVARSNFLESLLGEGLLCFIIYLAIAQLHISGTSVLVFLFIVTRIIPRISGINDARIRIAEYTEGIVYLKTIFSADALPLQHWGSVAKSNFCREITFQSVSFSYNSSKNTVLNDIKLTIAKNEKIAIVGESGAGKTTFIRLLLRLYDPTIGAITIDGINITDIQRDCWSNLVSVVSQDSFVFDDTVENNIKYSVEECTDKEFWIAVRRAKADEFINELPKKEKTELGERGVKLSGGQRQRISIARAFLRNSPILILDEATSALDSVTESMIQEALSDLSESRTMIVVAHRLSTIKNSDRIVVFDKGKIAEIGTHAELIENDHLYKKYHNLQIY